MRRMLSLAAPLLALAASCDYETPASAETLNQETRIFRARLEMSRHVLEIRQYHATHGEWPETWDDVGRRAPDPWGTPYAFEVDGDGIVIWSLGPDGEDGTGDEVYGSNP